MVKMEKLKRKRKPTSKFEEYMKKIEQANAEILQNDIPSKTRILQYPACVNGLDLNPRVKLEPIDYDVGVPTPVCLKTTNISQTICEEVEIKNECLQETNDEMVSPQYPNVSRLEDTTSLSNRDLCLIESFHPIQLHGVPDFILNPNKVFKVNSEKDFSVTITVCVICSGGFLSSVELRLHKERGCTNLAQQCASNETPMHVIKSPDTTKHLDGFIQNKTKQSKARPKSKRIPSEKHGDMSILRSILRMKNSDIVAKEIASNNTPNTNTHDEQVNNRTLPKKRKINLENNVTSKKDKIQSKCVQLVCSPSKKTAPSMVTLVPIENKGGSTLFKLAPDLKEQKGASVPIATLEEKPGDKASESDTVTAESPSAVSDMDTTNTVQIDHVSPQTPKHVMKSFDTPKHLHGFIQNKKQSKAGPGSKRILSVEDGDMSILKSIPRMKNSDIVVKEIASDNAPNTNTHDEQGNDRTTPKKRRINFKNNVTSKKDQIQSKCVQLVCSPSKKTAPSMVTLVPIENKGGSTLFKLAPDLKEQKGASVPVATLEEKPGDKASESDTVTAESPSAVSDMDTTNTVQIDHGYNKQTGNPADETSTAVDNITMSDDNDDNDTVENLVNVEPDIDKAIDTLQDMEEGEQKGKIKKLTLNEKLKRESLKQMLIKPHLDRLETEKDENGNVQYRCGDCGLLMRLTRSSCPTPESLKTRLLKHLYLHATKKFKCTLCDFDTADKQKLKYHMDKEHTTGKEYVCDLCGAAFTCEQNLGRHKLRHQKFPTCKLCGKKYENHKKLKAHMEYDHDGALLMHCDKCDAKFTTKDLLQKHKYKLHTVGYQVCPYCGLQFAELKFHLAKQHGVNSKSYTCPTCTYKTNDHKLYKNHVLRHKGEKPYGCDLCQWAGVKRDQWKSHMLSRHGFHERYRCKICNFSAPTDRDIYEHEKIHEDGSEMNGNVLARDTSNVQAISNDSINHHINEANAEAIDTETYYSCADCNTLYSTEEDLSAHFITEHGTDLGICGESQPQTVTEELVVDSVQEIPEMEMHVVSQLL